MKLTIFTGKATVAKGYEVKDQKLIKIGAENFYQGSFKTIDASHYALTSIVKGLKKGQFLTAGVHKSLDVGHCPKDATRAKEEFVFPDGEGLLIIDADSLQEFGINTVGDFVKRLRLLDDALENVQLVCSPSASSNIVFNEKNSGLKGLHCFISIDNAKAIPQILDTLHKRAVIAGFGRAQVTANGTILIKSLVDLAMKSSNQPCFEGGARLLNRSITQQLDIATYDGNALISSAIAPMTNDDELAYAKKRDELIKSVQTLADSSKDAWIAKRVDEMVAKGATASDAQNLIKSILDGGDLCGEMVIHTDKFGKTFVHEILANPAKYHEQTCADPLDPDYGQNKAKIYSNQEKPCIHSMAHGGCTNYFLKSSTDDFFDDIKNYTRPDLIAMVDSTTDFDELTANITQLVNTCNLRESEKEYILKKIAIKANVSLTSIKKDAKLYRHISTDKDKHHLEAAEEVLNSFGLGNLIDTNGFLWKWSGDGVWIKTNEREIKQRVHKIIGNPKLTAATVWSVLDMVKTEAHRPNHQFDKNPQGINCINGELNYIQGSWVLLPHERDHYRTTILPVAYDENAKANRFEQFLKEIFKGDIDEEDKASVILEAIGYTLVPTCHLEKFFMLVGNGANGKSVLLTILAELIGRDYTTAVQPSQFENRFQRGHLYGKLGNIITEIAQGAEIADAQLKSLVSGEMTTAEHKHKDPFDFVPYAKHWFGTNHLPHTRDFSDALFRRAIVLEFNNKFEGENRDVHLIDSLKSELPGILNLALKGLQRLYDNKAFTLCASSIEITKKWRQEADQVAQFIEEACVIGAHHRSSSLDLFSSYQYWAHDAGVKRTLNRNNFTNRLSRLGFEPVRGSGGTRMISGVKPRDGSEATTDGDLGLS
jgi:P4 family phage/plasmid primase-like protien